ncbi:MAG TPA: hypothetical protein VF331_12610 [Polyangiales bacterium]
MRFDRLVTCFVLVLQLTGCSLIDDFGKFQATLPNGDAGAAQGGSGGKGGAGGSGGTAGHAGTGGTGGGAGHAGSGGTATCGDGVVTGKEVCEPSLDACCNASCDGALPSTTVCRPSAGPCDVAEKCDGTQTQCPANSFAAATEICHPATGICDAAETCDGVSAACPADALAPDTQQCRPAGGLCDPADFCTGNSDGCPANQLSPATTVCRPAVGTCDIAEKCTGTSANCPTDQFTACSVTALSNTVPSSTSNTTTTGRCDQITPSCASASSTGSPDMVFSFTAPYAGTFVFYTSGDSFDDIMVLLDAAACNATELECADRTTGSSESVGRKLALGQTVAVVVDGSGGDSGAFTLNVKLVDPSWTCTPDFYGTGDGCDCGCGVVDLDCASAAVTDCNYCDTGGGCGTSSTCPGNINTTNNALCM